MSYSVAVSLPFILPIEPLNAGLFVSTCTGRHPVRTIDSYELLFMKSGTLDIFEATQTFHLEGGDALILLPDRLHGGISQYEEEDSFYYVHFNLHTVPVSPGAGVLEIPRVVHVESPERLIEFLHLYLDAQETGDLSQAYASFLLMSMFCEIERAAEDNRNARERIGHDALVARVESHIAKHYDEDISTSAIAESLNYNPDYLSRAFRQSTGHTITSAIHRRRIRDAKALLIQNYMNIDEIAVASGYRDAGYFRKIFKSMTGMTPHQFRDLHSHVHFTSH